MDEDRSERMFWIGVGGIAPLSVAAGLVSLRDVTSSVNVALVLVAVVVLVAAAGGRAPGAVAAVSSALSFDFFHTRPYLHLRIDSSDDVELTVLLLIVGLIVGHVAARGRHARRAADASRSEIRRIHRVAELAATGDNASDVLLATQAELTGLLSLQGCHFEAPPFGTGLPQLERSGTLSGGRHRYVHEGFELPPEGVELHVRGRGQLLGRFVLEPTQGTGTSLEQRIVAVALADQVGALLAAPRTGEKNKAHG